jgi:hypothetical protein
MKMDSRVPGVPKDSALEAREAKFIESERRDGNTRVGVPLLCHRSRSDQLKLADFLRSVRVTSVRAGCRQVIEVYGDLVENFFRPYNGRLFMKNFVLKLNRRSFQ